MGIVKEDGGACVSLRVPGATHVGPRKRRMPGGGTELPHEAPGQYMLDAHYVYQA